MAAAVSSQYPAKSRARRKGKRRQRFGERSVGAKGARAIEDRPDNNALNGSSASSRFFSRLKKGNRGRRAARRRRAITLRGADPHGVGISRKMIGCSVLG